MPSGGRRCLEYQQGSIGPRLLVCLYRGLLLPLCDRCPNPMQLWSLLPAWQPSTSPVPCRYHGDPAQPHERSGVRCLRGRDQLRSRKLVCRAMQGRAIRSQLEQRDVLKLSRRNASGPGRADWLQAMPARSAHTKAVTASIRLERCPLCACRTLLPGGDRYSDCLSSWHVERHDRAIVGWAVHRMRELSAIQNRSFIGIQLGPPADTACDPHAQHVHVHVPPCWHSLSATTASRLRQSLSLAARAPTAHRRDLRTLPSARLASLASPAHQVAPRAPFVSSRFTRWTPTPRRKARLTAKTVFAVALEAQSAPKAPRSQM